MLIRIINDKKKKVGKTIRTKAIKRVIQRKCITGFTFALNHRGLYSSN